MKSHVRAVYIVASCMLLIPIVMSIILFMPTGSTDKKDSRRITIEKGEGVRGIAKKLQNEDIVTFRLPLEIASRLIGGSGLKAGEYEFSSRLSPFEIARILSKGSQRPEQTLRIIEGWNARDIASYLEEQQYVSQKDFFSALQDPLWVNNYTFLADKPPASSLEGYLFPDTYRVFRDSAPKDLVVKMLDNFDQKFTFQMREDIRSSSLKFFDVLTAASIIELEVRTDDDRALVADIFFRRLVMGMPLQSDATVNYVTGKSSIQPTYGDLATESPYNTYLHRGLPPGPISNPGISSIKAAIYPKANAYLYFLTTTDGKVIYSKTYDDHLAAKRTYLK